MKHLLIVFSICFFVSHTSFSQDFEVAPVQLNFSTNPGESQVKFFTIKNHSSKKTSFMVTPGDFLVTKRGERNYLPAKSTTNSIANWLEITPNFVELNPNAEIQVRVTMQAPQDDASSKWGVLFIKTAKEQTPFSVDNRVSAGMVLSPQIAVLLYQSPKTESTTNIKINQLKEITSVTDTKRQFTANIDNKGNRITTCSVYLITASLKTASEVLYDPIKIEIFPGVSRLVHLELPNNLPAGKYALSAIVDYGSKENLEGTQILIDVK